MENKKTTDCNSFKSINKCFTIKYKLREESELIDAFCSKKSWGREAEYAWNSEID